jgi:queuine tRNA-ribosyltransferase
MPIATKGAVKNISPEDLKEIGAEIVLGNTYHLWLRPGDELVAKAGGLGKFMNWDGPILTDSGGYQVFSLGARAEGKFGSNGVTLSEEGVEFVDPVDGKKYFMSPEKSIDIQLNLGSDIIMVLDECPPYPCSHERAKESMELTLRWAKRCKEHFEKRIKNSQSHSERSEEARDSSAMPQNDKIINRPLLFGIVQGSIYEDLRKECAKRLIEIGFDGYAIGGVAVGEPRKHLYEILEWTVPLLPEDKPRYLMGLGKPEEVVRAVEAGIDMFDCVIPTREGRHGRLFLWKKPNDKFLISNFESNHNDKNLSNKKIQNTKYQIRDTNFYETINISNEKYKEDFSPIDPNCDCYTCQKYTKAYLSHLLRTNEPFFLKLASVHNLKFYIRLMKLFQSSQYVPPQ